MAVQYCCSHNQISENIMRVISTLAFTAILAALTGLANIGVASATSHAPVSEPAVRGLLMPYISPDRGRKLFASKGCVVCHAINGIGGEGAPSLNATDMPAIMNPFDFAASMWRGAATMITLQEDELGEQIEFTGDELIDIIAFVHDIEEQKKFTQADIPKRIAKLMLHLETSGEGHKHSVK
ncbi:MAG: c-type cytochrome [Alphaproteobacteria bacterium]